MRGYVTLNLLLCVYLAMYMYFLFSINSMGKVHVAA